MARELGYAEETFTGLAHIRSTALERFDSLFTPDLDVWAVRNMEHFHAAFVEQYEEGDRSFLEKLQKQLSKSDDNVIQLAAELLYVQQFFTTLTGAEKKIGNVREVLSWCGRAVPIPEWAVAGVRHGFASDQSFNVHRPNHLAWLCCFFLWWQKLEMEKRHSLLGEPWSFARAVRNVDSPHGAFQPMQEAWLYLVFPDSFEDISSRKDKRRIVEAFKSRVEGVPTDNIDADILKIRNHLSVEHGDGFSFYRTPVIEVWRPGKDPVISPPQQPKRVEVGARATQGSLEELGAALFLEPTHVFKQWADLLLDSRQLIFQGPPGTGKTFIARKLAAALAPEDNIELVQFHPSYSYEDFVEGFRPAGAGSFQLQPGPLKRVANRASRNKDEKFVLVIDEINRGNLTKVFGELYFLLEYRDEAIKLQYSPTESFQLPPNVLLIGTMNTADRSIALLDMALRRRFRFVDLLPDRAPVKGLLRRFLEQRAPDLSFLADMLEYVNNILNDPHASVGPSHFLLKDPQKLTEANAEVIWQYSILPALADRLFDRPGDLCRFEYQMVRTKTSRDDGAAVPSAIVQGQVGSATPDSN